MANRCVLLDEGTQRFNRRARCYIVYQIWSKPRRGLAEGTGEMSVVEEMGSDPEWTDELVGGSSAFGSAGDLGWCGRAYNTYLS